jgi:N-acyl homoserine lactone hydrolase
MGQCVIHPIPIYSVTMFKAQHTYRFNYGQKVEVANYVWYIDGTGEKILVDAGGDSNFSRSLGLPVRDIQTLEDGLSKVGVTCKDIEVVILTHLHYDHVAQASRFPKARFLVQADELSFAQKPHPVFAGGYVQKFFAGLPFHVINGDVQICNEVSVMKTSGHTPGGQSVVVRTDPSVTIISGLCTIRENFEPPLSIRDTLPVVPPTLHTNVFEAFDSLIKIKSRADLVLPLHDIELLESGRSIRAR